MFAAFLTTFFFALSGVTGQRLASRLGAQWGNFIRLLFAGTVLGIVTLTFFPQSLEKNVFTWFFISGLIGFGLGDVALYAAYTRLGSRLTFLLNLCLAPIFALALEWIWLGNFPGWEVAACVGIILTGVGLAVMRGAPDRGAHLYRGSFFTGVVAAVTAGFGQGAGAVISRKAESLARATGVDVPGISAAFQRVTAGLLVAMVVVVALRLLSPAGLRIPSFREQARFSGWLVGAALFGPVIGVSCFQWALQSQESGTVLAVVALTPIVMMPLSAITENDRPGPGAIAGSIIAVGGVVALYLWAV